MADPKRAKRAKAMRAGSKPRRARTPGPPNAPGMSRTGQSRKRAGYGRR